MGDLRAALEAATLHSEARACRSAAERDPDGERSLLWAAAASLDIVADHLAADPEPCPRCDELIRLGNDLRMERDAEHAAAVEAESKARAFYQRLAAIDAAVEAAGGAEAIHTQIDLHSPTHAEQDRVLVDLLAAVLRAVVGDAPAPAECPECDGWAFSDDTAPCGTCGRGGPIEADPAPAPAEDDLSAAAVNLRSFRSLGDAPAPAEREDGWHKASDAEVIRWIKHLLTADSHPGDARRFALLHIKAWENGKAMAPPDAPAPAPAPDERGDENDG